jgi:phage tail sheath protein FI
MPAYKTPGVYVEEISTLPPSVAEVSTAIPAFFGYTETGPKIARVSTLLEYEQLFGGPNLATFTVTVDAGRVTGVDRSSSAGPEFLMYYAVSHYFKNGGGVCYIVSVGNYGSTPAKSHFDDGLLLLEKEDEPTLIVLTDAVNLSTTTTVNNAPVTLYTNYYDLCHAALVQCHKLGDRFSIFDVPVGEVDGFRQNIGMEYLSYGAAYHPYLQTSLTYAYQDSGVLILPPPPWSKVIAADTVKVSFSGAAGALPTVSIVLDSALTTPTFTAAGRALTIKVGDDTTGAEVADAWTAWKAVAGNNPLGFAVVKAGAGGGTVVAAASAALGAGDTLDSIKSTNTALYNQIKARLTAELVVLPPSAAVAGIYASVDRDRGVWKAPANVSTAAVIGPVAKITNDDQESLNVDPTAGKSINAIRAFTGKGTLVWGARTLAGNDNEWRYVPVRRLFIMIEESARKATSFAVFEPNDATTWLKVKGMIESFLYGLWERGALAGPSPAAAYYVHVGLGKTMTTQDILEGRMIVEIGVAAVRPAEFIVLRFSHKLQEA